jgi:hypothetical protein
VHSSLTLDTTLGHFHLCNNLLVQTHLAEPRDGVEPVSLEDVTSVQHPVVVDEQHVAALHEEVDNVLAADIVNVLKILLLIHDRQDAYELHIAVEIVLASMFHTSRTVSKRD